MFDAISHAVLTRARTILALTLITLILAGALAAGAFARLRAGGFDDPAAEASRAAASLHDDLDQDGANLVLLITAPPGASVDDPAVAAAGREASARLEAQADVTVLTDYWNAPQAAAAGLRSTDSRSALVVAHLDGDEDAHADQIAVLQPAFTTTTSTGVRIETGGFAQNIAEITGQVKKDLARGAITADLMATLGRLWLFTEAFGPGLRWTTAVLDGGLLPPERRPQVLVTHAALLQQSVGPCVGELIEEAVQGLALAGDDNGLAEALALWSVEQYLNGELEEAARTSTRLIDHARAVVPWYLPEALSMFAVTQAALGRLDAANAAAQEAWELVTAAPSATFFVAVVSKIALAHTESGQARRALEVLEDAMAGSGRILGVEPTDTMLINAGWAALACDRAEAGLDYFGQAIAHAPRASITLGLAEALLGAACALAARGDHRAGAALVSSEVLVAELGMVPSPWQREQVAAARARLTEPHPGDPTPGASPRSRADAIRALLPAV